MEPTQPAQIEENLDYSDKNVVKELNLTLDNIVKVSKAVFPKIQEARDKTLILACGNTGCGKSTLITSLVFGPNMLEEKRVQSIRTLADGRERVIYNRIIDHTDELKKKLKDDGIQDLFNIGHSKAESMTFIPHFYKPDNQDFTYSDIAGLLDTSGDLFDYVSCFMNKKIFNHAKKVLFIVPMTRNQLDDAKGKAIIQQVEVILNMCSQSYTDVIKSVQPVMTKLEPSQDEEEIVDEDDIDVIRSRLKDIFDQYLQNYNKTRLEEIIQREETQISINGEIDRGNLEDREKLE